MPRINSYIVRTGSAAPSPADFFVGEPAWDSTAGAFYLKRADGDFIRIGPYSAGSGISISPSGVITAMGGGGGGSSDASSLTSGTLDTARLEIHPFLLMGA